MAQYKKLQRLLLENHPELDEHWVQALIADDPGILGLGDLVLKDKERVQARAGRLDLLLQDPETSKRYEVEVQLGSTDESHIIRTVEYWDIERKRYPQYEHCAVIVAEDVTSRFLNIINLFNGTIPLVAIQMRALQVSADEYALIFTTVVDELTRGLVDDDEEVQEVTDRAYWENKASKATLGLVDQLHQVARELDPGLELNYTKFYVGLAKNGQPCNFIIMRPWKSWLTLTIRLPQAAETQARLEKSGLEVEDYDTRERGYRLRLVADGFEKRRAALRQFVEAAHKRHVE